MKTLKIFLSALAAAALLTAGGCQDDYTAPALQVPVATMEPNTTIADFKAAIADYSVDVCPNRPDGLPYIIHGRVISSDITGNIYQNLMIQDETSAITLNIGQADMHTVFPLGQDIVINVTGLWVGQTNGLFCIGSYYENIGTPQVGRMPYQEFREHCQLNGLPNDHFKYVKYGEEYPKDNPYCIIVGIDQIPSAGVEMRDIQSQLVEVRNVSFLNAGELNFAPDQENANRTIRNKDGGELTVRNSGYSTFHNDILPTGTGTVRGILSYYGGWQLLLRSRSDVIFNAQGQSYGDPLDVAQVIELGNNGQEGWVKGYIVGCVLPGVQTVASSADVLFGNEGAVAPDNVLIADDADCTDYTKCLVVRLPADTRLREYASLLENPDAYKRQLTVLGTFGPYLGMAGVIDCPGELLLEGFEINGSETTPFTCAYILENYEKGERGFSEGYIVGYIEGRDYENGVRFGCPEAGKDFNRAYVVIGPKPSCTEADKDLCVVVNTGSFRDKIGLYDNPDNYNKLLVVEGTLGTALKRAAVLDVESCFFKSK